MESDGDDLENIFEEYENNENYDGAEDTENKTANETPGAVKIAAPKRIVRNPRLKFNADRLIGERGIPVLVDHFKNVKFKGQGHEKEDLDKLLSKLEHWTHRLFPSMKFEDCLTHIERLGKKRPVQTCLRKLRLDMPILSSDFVKDDDDEDVVKRNENSEPVDISAFDRLLGESQEMSNIDAPVSENVSNTSSFYSSPMIDDTSAHVLGSSFGQSLTEEQKERIERNKMLAAERRKARLATMEQNAVKMQSESHATTFSQNILSEQNVFDKLLNSTECIEKNNSGLENCHDIHISSKKSSNLDCDHSEELGLDDLINLVDEEEPVIEENAVSSVSERFDSVSSNINETNKAENFKNFHSVLEEVKNGNLPSSKESESSLKGNLNMESSFDLTCETSMNSKSNADAYLSTHSIFASEENVLMENKDLISMNCENENFNNVNEINKLSQDDVEKPKTFHDISENTENIILSDPKNSQKSSEEISNMDSSLDLVCEASADFKVNIYTDDSVKDTSVCDENVIMVNEDIVSMDCEDENS